jgi:hypothetical protein
MLFRFDLLPDGPRKPSFLKSSSSPSPAPQNKIFHGIITLTYKSGAESWSICYQVLHKLAWENHRLRPAMFVHTWKLTKLIRQFFLNVSHLHLLRFRLPSRNHHHRQIPNHRS